MIGFNNEYDYLFVIGIILFCGLVSAFIVIITSDIDFD